MLHFIVNTIRRTYIGFSTKTNKQYASDKHKLHKGRSNFCRCTMHDRVADATQALLCESRQYKLKTEPNNIHMP